jgi:hypothetical protein
MSVALPKYRETRRLKSPCGSNAGFLCDNGWHYQVPAAVRFAFFLGTAYFFYVPVPPVFAHAGLCLLTCMGRDSAPDAGLSH